MGQGWLQLVAEPAEGGWDLGFHRLWAALPREEAPSTPAASCLGMEEHRRWEPLAPALGFWERETSVCAGERELSC